MFINEKYKAPLNKYIQKEYNDLLFVVSAIAPNDRMIKDIDGTGGKVNIPDLIAYQIGWGNLVINWYEIGLKGKMPQMPGEGFSTWDYVGLARHFYKKYQYDSGSNQIQEFCKVVKKIIAIVEHEYQAQNLDRVGIWPWCTLSSGKKWPLSKFINVNAVAPYRRAKLLIRKFIKNHELVLQQQNLTEIV